MAQSKTTTNKEYIYAVGRRKEASVRLRLFKGEGANMINDKDAGEVFKETALRAIFVKPLQVVDGVNKYYFTAKVAGGGIHARAEAISLALSRALANDEETKKLLRTEGLLTRDARARQRRMVGTGGKARRKKQSPKR